MKFIASADWQLGMTAHFLPDEARARFRQARIDVLERIGEVAVEHDAEFVVVAGDVYESNQLDRQVIVRSLEAMGRIPVPVWLLPGNHDPHDAASIYRSAEFLKHVPANVHVLDTKGLHQVTGDIDVVAAPWFSKAPLSDLVNDALSGLEPDPARRRIVVGHGAWWSANHTDPRAIDIARVERAVADGLIDFCVLGDHHSTNGIGEHTWYPGTPEVTRHREHDPGNVLVVELGDGPPDVTPVRVGTWTFDVVDATLDSPAAVDHLVERLRGLPDKQRRAVWLKLVGTLSLQDKARLDEALEAQADAFALLEHWERHTDVVVLPGDGEIGDLGLTGFAREAVDELSSLAESPDDAQATTARDALSLLYRLVGAAS